MKKNISIITHTDSQMNDRLESHYRRDFLVKGTAAVSLLAFPIAFAQQHHGMMGSGNHMQHGMSHGEMGMGMHGGHDMSGMMGGDMGVPPMVREGYQLGVNTLTQKDIDIMARANVDLMAEDKMPSGKSLPTLKKLVNESSEQGVFKGTLRVQKASVELIPGTMTEVWAYNGELPGPQIEVYEGDRVSIEVFNDLPEATTVHWHGLLVPAAEDGNPQDPIEPGKSRVYSFDIPEGTAGTYWYHPHGHGTVAKQVFKGLAGTFIVKRKNDPFADIPEQQLLISDLKLHSDGSIAENSFFDWMNGREGQFTLVNGALNPKVTIDGATRLRIWNACSARYINLDFDFAESYLIATDGGYIEMPEKLTKILLSPGERIEVVVIPRRNADVKFMNMSYNRNKMGPVSVTPSYSLATLQMKVGADYTLPQKLAELPNYGAPASTHHIEYTEVMNMGQLLFLINDKMHDMNRVDEVVQKDALEEWVVFNNSHMDHNFHIHGTQFMVKSHEVNGQKTVETRKAFKDTINLKPYETVTLLMKQDFTGLRMYHCHILEHETLGMMGQLETKA
ncbi:multicopper oxidase family protein [Ignatzschineria indica]|uniref:multicopper oxidase family protein n=1 Tax=Ignatzschineria indica TaxID=472583 RepID=UPI002575B77B|nr:multicopper oxidase family protein [Ignatzschineria indica]MDM1545603.1 multicopper oxidase family protein [Ignatzschineria indica]